MADLIEIEGQQRDEKGQGRGHTRVLALWEVQVVDERSGLGRRVWRGEGGYYRSLGVEL